MNKLLIDIRELSKLLGISEKTLYAWVHQRKIPFIKIGGLLKFDSHDIQKWIQKKKVEPSKLWK
jgi:excisionase family DNA binding protein